MILNFDMIKNVYAKMHKRIKDAREILSKPLTFTEKILYSHLFDISEKEKIHLGDSYINFFPDRIAMQDATAQMALLQFMKTGKEKVAVNTTVHCDHLIQAKFGSEADLEIANDTNEEVYNFLSSVSNKYGIGFWKPGAGIIHQVVLENYAFPGGMMIGTDSHTPNAGGLGMIAIGVGGADAVDLMAGMPWELKMPKIIGVKLTGKLNGWTSAKDVILHIAGLLTVKGGTGAIIEYFGEGAESISCTGKATICNMGAEVGATTSNFAYDKKMENYLRASSRAELADECNKISNDLKADKEVYENPTKYYHKVIEINLSELEPHINGPFSPDKAWKLSEFSKAVKENNYPEKMEVGLIGSCTNSSYEDITRASSIAKQVSEKNLKVKSKYFISPGSEQVNYTIRRDGLLDILEKINGNVLANACGPCIGQWAREGADKKERNSIMTSFNRNFAKRADGNPNTFAFVASPEIVTAFAIAGNLNFNPITGFLLNENNEKVKLDEPKGLELPLNNFEVKDNGYIAPLEDGSKIKVIINPKSERLQVLTPFKAWDKKDIRNMKLLIKAKGKCTTDHISMAGIWLQYRGHLDNISNNMLIGALNYFNEKVNSIKNQLDGKYDKVPKIARIYKKKNISTIIVGDENYGEGSSREHAAMEPRHLGVKVVLVKSFARIHETNLKKQGVLALTFYDKSDYDKIQEDDNISILGLKDFSSGKNLVVFLEHKNGKKDEILVNHTYNSQQIDWFTYGSAVNYLSR